MLRKRGVARGNTRVGRGTRRSSPTAVQEDRLGESQPLLSPPARDVAPSYLCDWAQATQCLLTSLKPEPCQRKGCNVFVHHLCQGEWERREGYEDTVARLCCRHQPDYKYRMAPAKDDVGVVPAVVATARAINVQSQVTTEGLEESSDDEESDESENLGDDDLLVEDRQEEGVGEEEDDQDDDVHRAEDEELPRFDIDRIDDYAITDYTANQFDIHERVAHFMERRPISTYNRIAVEAAYMVEAGLDSRQEYENYVQA